MIRCLFVTLVVFMFLVFTVPANSEKVTSSAEGRNSDIYKNLINIQQENKKIFDSVKLAGKKNAEVQEKFIKVQNDNRKIAETAERVQRHLEFQRNLIKTQNENMIINKIVKK